MKLSALNKILMLILVLIFLVSLSGVSATWYYARGDAHRQEAAPGITLSEFTWKSEEILPTTTPGENHLVIIKNLLGDAKGGLNTKQDVVTRNLETLLYSHENVQGGNLKHIFTTESSKLLMFILEYVSDEEINVYTFNDPNQHANMEVDKSVIEVFKTKLTDVSGTWISAGTTFGFATVREHPTDSLLAIDISEWQAGHLENN